MATLRVSDQRGEESRVELDTSRRYTIGRAEGNDVVLHDSLLSRRHAELFFSDEGWMLADRGSSNGTFVNGRRIEKPVCLGAADRATLGNCKLAVVPEGAARGKVSLDDEPVSSGGTVKLASREALATELQSGPDVDPVRAELRRIRRRYAVVERATLELPAHEPVAALLPRVLDLAFEAVRPDRGALLLLGDDGKLRSRAEKGLGGGDMTISRTIADSVIAERVSILTADALVDTRFAARQSIARQQIHGAMAVPLWNDREVTGLLYVDSLDARRRFDEEDLKVLTMLANVAAIQIENAHLFREQLEKRRFEEEAHAAAEIQRGLIPDVVPDVPGYSFLGYSEPCHEVGGDYLDWIRTGQGWLLVAVGDVSGKGMGAALMMAGLHANLRARVEAEHTLEDVIVDVDRALARTAPINRFVSLVLMELDPGTHRLRVINAGHVPAPCIVRATGGVEELPPTGPPLCIDPGARYPAHEVRLEPGDFLFTASDGVSELADEEGRMFGEERLLETLRACAGRSPEEVRGELERRIAAHAGEGARQDDLTVAILRRVSRSDPD